MRKYLLAMMLSMLTVQAFGQGVNQNVDITRTNTYEIEYDFSTGRYTKNNLRLRVNTPVVYRIKNINRLAYKIAIAAKDSILAETFIGEEPLSADAAARSGLLEAELRIVETGNFASGQGLGIESLVAQEDVRKERQDSAQRFISGLKESLALNERQKEKQLLLDKAREYKIIIAGLDSDTTRLSDEQKKHEEERLVQKKEELEKIEKEVRKLDREIDSALLVLKKQEEVLKKFVRDNLVLHESFYHLKASYQSLIRLQHSYGEIRTIADNPYLNKAYYLKNNKGTVDSIRGQVIVLKEIVRDFGNRYNDVNIAYSHLKYNPYLSEMFTYGGNIKLFAQADYFKELADKMNEEVGKIAVGTLLQKIEHLTTFLEEESTYTIESAPIQPLNDVAIFQISIKKNGDNHADISNERTFHHREFTYGGTRIDFSMGLAASYFWNTPVYELGSSLDVDAGGERTLQISKKADNLVVPSLLGLVTMSRRKTGYVAYGGSAGLGIDVVDGKIQLSNFFAGGTVLFGKFERIFLTAGCSFRNVGQLRNGYSIDDNIPGDAANIQTFISSKYKVGGFLALTYNLTKGAKDNYRRFKEL